MAKTRSLLVLLLFTSALIDPNGLGLRSRSFLVDAQAFYDDKSRDQAFASSNSDSDDFKTKKSNLLSPFVFQTDRPAHVIEGTSNAIGNAVKGVVGGAASLVGFPVLGAKYAGVPGLLIGALLGTLTGVSLPLTGIFLGLTQFAWGIKCTPSAIKDSLMSKTCRPQYLLDGEAKDLSDKLKFGEVGTRSRAGVSVKNTLFYDMLQVSPDATPNEIKRGYYKTAKEYHPDKSNDAHAEEKFRKIHTAYQTLSDAKKRNQYDRNGPRLDDNGSFEDEHVLSLTNAVDPLVFFSIMFGSELVEPYIGELRFASQVDMMAQHFNIHKGEASFDSYGYSMSYSDSTSIQQQKRLVDIAMKLRERTMAYVSGAITKPEFIQSCQDEAEMIAKSTFGGIFLKAIGSSMLMEAQQFLGFHTAIIGWARGSVSWLKKAAHEKRTDMRVYMAFFKSVKSLLDAASFSIKYHMETEEGIQRQDSTSESKRERHSFHAPEMDKEKLEEKLLDSMSTFLETAWAFNVKDVTDTVKDSCHKMLADEGVPMDVRLKRAEALRILGKEFYNTGKATAGDEVIPRSVLNDIQERAEIALTSATMKIRLSTRESCPCDTLRALLDRTAFCMT